MDAKLDKFFNNLAQSNNRLLMTDYDGTLAPFVIDRDKAFPYPGLNERLEKLISSENTQVVIISGRAIGDLKPLLKLKKYPEMWGSHGWENSDINEKYTLKSADPDDLALLKAAREYIYESKLEQHLEEKPVSLAIHYRGIDPKLVVEMQSRIEHNWKRITSKSNLIYDKFDGGLELKLPGFNKGHVVDEIMGRYDSPPAAAYLGDDLTDEDAFRALKDKALCVHVKDRESSTAADIRISPPEELLEFLDRWIEFETDR